MFYAGDVDEFVAVRHRRVKGLRICLRGTIRGVCCWGWTWRVVQRRWSRFPPFLDHQDLVWIQGRGWTRGCYHPAEGFDTNHKAGAVFKKSLEPRQEPLFKIKWSQSQPYLKSSIKHFPHICLDLKKDTSCIYTKHSLIAYAISRLIRIIKKKTFAYATMKRPHVRDFSVKFRISSSFVVAFANVLQMRMCHMRLFYSSCS